MCEELIADLLKIPQSADFIDLVDKKKVGFLLTQELKIITGLLFRFVLIYSS